MHFEKFDAGRFRIYTAATETAYGEGYQAAVRVKRVRGENAPLEVYKSRETGAVWPSARAALDAALTEGLAVVERLSPKLESFVAELTPSNLHPETRTGAARGNEYPL